MPFGSIMHVVLWSSPDKFVVRVTLQDFRSSKEEDLSGAFKLSGR